jgi:outer membrane murein-binding lipoprotein Lpp
MMRSFSVTVILNYGLPIATAALGILYLAKDWQSHKKSWRRLLGVGLIVLIGIGGAVNAHYSRKEDVRLRGQYREQVSSLQSAVLTANKNQENNTKQFLAAFGQLSNKVNELRAQVQTAGLREEADKLKTELESMQKVLKPRKAVLAFTFAKPRIDDPPLRTVTLPVKDDIVHVEFAVKNDSDVTALNGALTLIISNGCEFASEPQKFGKIPGAPNTQRSMSFDRIFPHTEGEDLNADIRVPKNISTMEIGVTYRCTNCDAPGTRANVGTVRLSR